MIPNAVLWMLFEMVKLNSLIGKLIRFFVKLDFLKLVL